MALYHLKYITLQIQKCTIFISSSFYIYIHNSNLISNITSNPIIQNTLHLLPAFLRLPAAPCYACCAYLLRLPAALACGALLRLPAAPCCACLRRLAAHAALACDALLCLPAAPLCCACCACLRRLFAARACGAA